MMAVAMLVAVSPFTALRLAAQAITAPEQDCVGALPIADSVFIQPNSYRGFGKINELGLSCIGVERNSAWYKVTAQADGQLGFELIPNNPRDDYDWSVFLIPPGRTCADIAAGAVPEVSCNFSTMPGNTGANGAGAGNKQDSKGSPFNATISVRAGETYYIVITNYIVNTIANTAGYQLRFTSSSKGVIGTGVTGATVIPSGAPSPRIVSLTVDQGTCSVQNLNVLFSEYMKCNSIIPDDFTITGADGAKYPVTEVFSSRMERSTDNFDTLFTLTFANPILQSGVYKFAVTGTVNTLSGIPFPTASTTLTINLPNINPSITGATVFCANGNTSLDAGGGYLSYQWYKGLTGNVLVGNGQSLFVTEPDVYTVIVRDKSGCSGRSSISTRHRTDRLPVNIGGFRYMCGSGPALLDAGDGYKIYQWSTGDSTRFITVKKPGTYTVNVLDVQGCSGTSTAVVTLLTSITPRITGASQFCQGDTIWLYAGEYATYEWYYEGALMKDLQWSYVPVTKPGTYKVRVATNGCTAESAPFVLKMNLLPAKPIVNINGNICTAPLAASYQWNKVIGQTHIPIPQANDRTFSPTQITGLYSVTVRDTNSCASRSDSLFFVHVDGDAELEVGTVTAEQGKLVDIPIYLRKNRNVSQTGATQFSVMLRCNQSLLVPEDRRITENTVARGERFVKLTLPVQPIDPQTGLLDKFTFRAQSGSTSSTLLVLENAVSLPLGSGVVTTTINGKFSLTGFYVVVTSAALVLESHPNPVTDELTCVFSVPENDTISLTIVDVMGNTVKSLLTNERVLAGANTITVNVSNLEKGTYFVVIRSSKQRIASGFTVMR